MLGPQALDGQTHRAAGLLRKLGLRQASGRGPQRWTKSKAWQKRCAAMRQRYLLGTTTTVTCSEAVTLPMHLNSFSGVALFKVLAKWWHCYLAQVLLSTSSLPTTFSQLSQRVSFCPHANSPSDMKLSHVRLYTAQSPPAYMHMKLT